MYLTECTKNVNMDFSICVKSGRGCDLTRTTVTVRQRFGLLHNRLKWRYVKNLLTSGNRGRVFGHGGKCPLPLKCPRLIADRPDQESHGA